MEGKVKFFNESKGFGFIQGDNGQEYFVHITDLIKLTSLKENDDVIFKTRKGDKGEKAVEVYLKKDAPLFVENDPKEDEKLAFSEDF